MSLKKYSVKPTYKKENGLWLLNIEDIPLPDGFVVKERSLVSIPPHQLGGNHKHPRIELMIGMGPLNIYWLEDGVQVKEHMSYDDEIYLFEIPSYVPHAVVNTSKTEVGILFELANDVQHDVESIEVFRLS